MPDIIEFPLPTSAADPQWQDYCRLGREYDHELLGTAEWDESPEDALLQAAAETDYTQRRYLAHVDGEAVGRARILVNHVDDPDAAALHVDVHPDHRGRGVGRALADRLVQDTAGFTRFETWPMAAPPAPGEQVLMPSSGAGAVPADHPGVRLAQSYGFALAQIERVSRYDIAAPAVDPAAALAEAERFSADYEVHAWEGPGDASARADLAVLKARMSTDVPAGDLTVAEQTWDAERVRRTEEQILLTGRLFRAVARHRGTGRIVGLNELVAPRSRASGVVDQWDTIVLPEHRGHRLGMRVKAANVVALREAMPEARAIITWNAEENRPMLNVNEALGFRPILVEAAMEATAPLRRAVD
ncbi:GNAT family N-acetyltransferase [Micrococcus sp. M4NT]|uniref:GNAT family N-acetyltransferase n=1 Tax=Micrococcus sp. M4NT TaxID=2957501 RepID=UPI0029AE23C6|nr:GNAT family N-acetyltransferase [Micrococcus sp. M4NT]MDX2341648.1 GNAT family N-acetyltransferase [Micrococcus sp. M4NT]